MAFLPNETVYCRFTGQAFTVVSCDGVVAHLSDGTGRIVGELTREAPRRRVSIVEHIMFGDAR